MIKIENISDSITKISSSLAQIILCMIFWELGKKREPQKVKENPQVTQNIPSVNFDEDSEEEEVPQTIYNSAEERRKF